MSIATVSRVLNESASVGEEKRRRVEQAARELGYSPNPIALNLLGRKTGGIGVLLPHIAGDFFSEFLEGIDRVTFTVATNPGTPAGPLNKIASGGELSRFLLALKVCLSGRRAEGLTMIFDEIDRGVGGATADAVGRRLAQVAQGAQVLVVTHSPQVAALGTHHWRVEKRVHAGMTTSTVTPLPGADRVDEIARMLSGDTITEEARGAARALLAG